MSNSRSYEEVTISSQGVTVTKRFEEDEFPVPAIAFEFDSNRDEEVDVRLTDPVPGNIEVEDLGFHPEYGSEYWTIDDNTITFERALSPRASYTTVYGIRATGSDNIQQFLAEPTLEKVDPPLPDDRAVVPQGGDDVVKNAIAGDGEIPGLDDGDDESDEDEEVATLDLNDPSQQGGDTPQPGRTDDGGTADGGAADAGTAPATLEGESLVAAMAAEIREQNVSAEDVKLLRQAFEIAGQEGGSTAAKVEQIQSDIADLRAYTGSLEEFLDENGTAQTMLTEFDERVDEFDERIEEFDGRIDEFASDIEANSQQLSSVDDEVGSVSDQVSSISSDVESLDESVESVESEVESVESEVESVGREIDAVASELNTLDQEVDTVSGNLEEFDETVADLETTIQEVEENVAALEQQVTDGDVAKQIEAIEQNVSDLKDWQEQIKRTFGG